MRWPTLLAAFGFTAMVGLAAISVLGEKASGTFTSVGSTLNGTGGGGGRWTPPHAMPPAPRPAEGEALVGMDRPTSVPVRVQPSETPTPREPRLPQSGTLTAGSLDDSIDPHSFASFLRKLGQNVHCGGLPAEFSGRHLTIVVKDGDGSPISNARVRVTSAADTGNAAGVTRSDGRAILLAGWDRLSESAEWKVTVTPPGQGRPVVETIPASASRWEITLPETKAALPTRLDLGIVLDTTGSMGDELRFLQGEIKGITATIKSDFPNVDQRFGLVLYRDQGDAYVTRTFSFTPSIEEFHRKLAAQSAAGGGDEPEAIHLGLEEARKLGWREGNTARVLFLLTDAPPHSQHMRRTLEAADALRKQGVAIYPIACSGYNDPTEFTLRACALMTGSAFLFLTNDSGVGAAHADPHASSFQVEKLDRLMVRMIAGELSGRRIDPEKPEVLRTVGKPVNGSTRR